MKIYRSGMNAFLFILVICLITRGKLPNFLLKVAWFHIESAIDKFLSMLVTVSIYLSCFV